MRGPEPGRNAPCSSGHSWNSGCTTRVPLPVGRLTLCWSTYCAWQALHRVLSGMWWETESFSGSKTLQLPALEGAPPLTARPEVKFNPVHRAKSLQSCPLYAAPWTVAHRAPLSMGFSRQEYWGGLPCPPPGDLPDAGFEPTPLTSPVFTGRFFTTSTPWQTRVQPTLCWAFLFKLNWHSQSCSSQLHGWFWIFRVGKLVSWV